MGMPDLRARCGQKRGCRRRGSTAFDGGMKRDLRHLAQPCQARGKRAIDQIDRIPKRRQPVHGGAQRVRRQVPQEGFGGGKADAMQLLRPDLPAL